MDSSTDTQQRQSKKKIVFLVLKNKQKLIILVKGQLYRPLEKSKDKKQIEKNIQCVIIASEDTCREKPSKAQNVSYLT